MNSSRKLFFVGMLLLTCIGCDQATKQIALTTLQHLSPRILFNDILRLQYAENSGGMMSLGAGLHPEVRFWFLIVFVGVMLGAILLFTLFSRKLSKLQTASLTLIVGGGFSNLLDRLQHDGHVIDFLNIGFGTLRTAIFNFADVVIILGAVLLLLSPWFTTKQEPPLPSEVNRL